MKELELKILNINKRKIKEKLNKLQAKLILKQTLFQEWYFEIPGLTQEEREFYSLRLRTEGKKSFLTAKNQSKIQKEDRRYHINKEIEIEILNVQNLKKLLNLLRFNIFRQREKTREIYQLGRVKLAIDQYPKIAPYMEIEGPSKKNIIEIVKKLGYSPKDTTNKTATILIKEAGINPNSLFF